MCHSELRELAVSLLVLTLLACGERSAPAAGQDTDPSDAGVLRRETSDSAGPIGQDIPVTGTTPAPQGPTDPGGQPYTCDYPDPEPVCAASWESAFEALTLPQPPWTVRSSTCSSESSVGKQATVCTCRFDAGPNVVEKRVGLLALWADPSGACEVPSRKRDPCLIDHGEFSGCDPERPDTSCSSTCALLAERHNTLDAPASEVEVLTTRCATPRRCDGSGNRCHVVARIDDRCVVGHDPHRLNRIDCAADAEQLLSQALDCIYLDGDDGGVSDEDAGSSR